MRVTAFALFARAALQKRHTPVAKSGPLKRKMRVAVAGCVHGELDLLYDAVAEAQRVAGPVDLIVCPGDLQAVRNADDLECMACPDKYKDMRSFWKYYSGESAISVPTVFVGGNHEASNHLQEIPLGGLVAPNLYYIGNAGVVNFNGLRIAGISGVYTEHNYRKPRLERPPYHGNQIKSVYHTREEDVLRLMRISRHVDIFVSHDWPRSVIHNGDVDELLRHKPFLKTEIRNGSFGNPGTAHLLEKLQPTYWFAAHMHVKFPAIFQHPSGKTTQFLALDKILPRRDFLQILDISVPADPTRNLFSNYERPSPTNGESLLELDPEWLTVLMTEARNGATEGPVTDGEIDELKRRFETAGVTPALLSCSDFAPSVPVHDPRSRGRGERPSQLMLQSHTTRLANTLGLNLELPRPLLQAEAAPDESATVRSVDSRIKEWISEETECTNSTKKQKVTDT